MYYNKNNEITPLPPVVIRQPMTPHSYRIHNVRLKHLSHALRFSSK